MHKALSLLILISIAGIGTAPQPVPQTPASSQPTPAAPALRIRGTGLNDLNLSHSDLAAMPRRTVITKDHDGAESKYEGVTIQQLLTKAGMGFGQSLRGPRLRDYLLAEAGDNYAVVFALPELTEEFSDRIVIVADRLDGAPIADKDGPLRIIVSDEKKHARWVRNLVSLTIRTDVPQQQSK